MGCIAYNSLIVIKLIASSDQTFYRVKIVRNGKKSPDTWFISVSYLSGPVPRLKAVHEPKQFPA